MLGSIDYFWTHYENIVDGVGYGLFGMGHIFWLIAMVVMIVLISILYGKADEGNKLNIRKTIAAILIFSDIFKLCTMALTGVDITYYLPLEICSFAAYSILLDSMWPGNKFFPEMQLLLFLPAAIMAQISPTTTALPTINFFTIHQFVYHGLIAAYVIARFANKEIDLSYFGMWKSVAKICLLAAPIYVLNKRFGINLMFLVRTDDNPLLNVIWDVSGGGIRYTIGLVIFVIIMLHVFFAIFKGIDKLIRAK